MRRSAVDYRSRRPPGEPDYVIRHTAPPGIRYDDSREALYERERARVRSRDRSRSPLRTRSRGHYDRPEINIYDYESRDHYRGHDGRSSPPVVISNVRRRGYSPGSGSDSDVVTRGIRRMQQERSSEYERGPSPSRLLDPLTANIVKFKLEAMSDLSGGPTISTSSNVLSKGKPNAASRSCKASHVFRSEYTGEGHLEGAHSVALATRSDPEGESSSIFRWLHVKQSVMNLDALSSDIDALPELTPAQRKAITRLLGDVKKNASRPVRVSKDATVRHMDPGVRQLDLPPSNDEINVHSKPTQVTWLCIPYFSLERYSGFLSSSNPGSYPTQTLLQASYARIAYGRDMKQAARQIGSGDRGWCFHIPQVWCLVVGNSLLVTCGLMDEPTLRSKVVSVHDEIPRPPNSRGLKGARILVTYGDSVTWSIPAEECETFLTFSAHFRDLWPAELEFHHNQRLLSREAWPDVVALLQGARSSVTFTMKARSAPPFQASLRLYELYRGHKQGLADKKSRSPEPTRLAISSPPTGDEASEKEEKTTQTPLRNPNEVFHVFSWIKTKTSTAADYPNYEDIKKRLEQVSELLSGEDNVSGSEAFKAAGMAQRASVHSHIGLQDKKAADGGGGRGRPEKRQAAAIRLFNTADVMYNFFFPRRTEGPTIQKYWGSILKLATTQIQDTSRPGRPKRRPADNAIHPSVDSVLRLFDDIIPSMQVFKRLLAQATETERANIRVPDDLARAWPLIVMALIHSCGGIQGAWYEQLSFATTLIASGMADLMDSLSTSTLIDRVSILPMDLVSLMSVRLLADTTGNYSSTSETYLEYLGRLEAQISSMPSGQNYETRINHVQEELSVVRKIIDAQRTIFKFIGSQSRSTGEITDPGGHRARPFETYGGIGRSAPNRNRPAAGEADDTALQLPLYELSPVRDLLVWECIDLLERKRKEFQGYDLHAQSLDRLNASKVTGTKDKREEAIYIFTLVTIIFLPLSAVSSIFGMNTSDVRDMESSMWVYWAVAIPVTLLVILLGLWWMGELDKFAMWAGRKMRGQEGLSDEIPPPPYPGHQVRSTIAPEEPVVRTRSTYQERYRRGRSPSPDDESDYGPREDRRRDEERRAQERRMDREKQLAEEIRFERRKLEEERAKRRLELEEAEKRRVEEWERKRKQEEAEKRAADEMRVRVEERRGGEVRERERERERRTGQDSDEGVSRRAPYRGPTEDIYD